MTTNQVSFLDKAMELCNSMMQFSGCELYSYNTRPLLKGLKACVNSNDEENAPRISAKIGCINLLIDTLLEEEGIAEAEMLASCDLEPYYEEDWDDHDEACYEEYPEEECYGPDPMWSAEDAFAYLEEQEYFNECDKENYLKGNTIEDLAEIDERHDNDDEIEEYANTPHDDVNVELKQTLEDIKNAQITKAIWEAREHMMSKIVFDNDDAYPIHKIDFDLDDEGIPVDIVISTREKYLDYIAANHCQLGYNLNDEEEHGFKTALYGRLDSFRLYDYKGEPISWDSLPSALYRAVHKVMQSKLCQEVIEDTLLGIANGGITSISGIVQLLMENLEDWDK